MDKKFREHYGKRLTALFAESPFVTTADLVEALDLDNDDPNRTRAVRTMAREIGYPLEHMRRNRWVSGQP